MQASPVNVVVSDVHLSTTPRPRIAEALCGLIEAYPRAELIFAGDLFEFSVMGSADPSSMWEQLRAVNREVIGALRRHVDGGGRVTLLAGNHDAALTAVADEVTSSLGGSDRVEVAPWFVRRGDVHVEHGNLWDRDNAPLHPLADWSAATEPLGIALMRRFVARRGALEFAHAHDTTPLAGLRRAFRLFGLRTPLVLGQYFATAGALCFEAGKRRKLQALEAEILGEQRLVQIAAQTGLDPTRLGAVLAGAPEPTHLRFSDTFMRLYFDRVLASLTATGSGLLALSFALPLAFGVFGLSSAYLAVSVLRPEVRYQGPVQALRDASRVIVEALGARCVIFGHTHVPEASENYVNLGSFAYAGARADGRPYAVIEADQRVELRRWPVSA